MISHELSSKELVPHDHRPDARSYLDACAYLQAIFAWRQSQDKKFSHAVWASELGFQSRMFLRLMVLGKRKITESSLQLFVSGLKLKGTEAEYFAALVRFSQAATVELRERYSNDLKRFGRARPSSSKIVDHYRFLSSWNAPAILSLLTREDFCKTPEAIAHLLGVRLPDINDALRTLENLGLASQKDGIWSSENQIFQQSDELGNAALKSYHFKSLEHSIKSIEIDPELRRFQSLLTFLSSDELQDVNERVVAFLGQILTEQSQKPDRSGQRLYQIHVSLKPISEPIFHSNDVLSEPIGSQSCSMKEEEK